MHHINKCTFPAFPPTHLSVRVKSPCSFVDASRTMKEPSGLSRSFSFTSSLKRKGKTVSAAVGVCLRRRAWIGAAYLLMSPQYHSASWSEYGGGKWLLLFVVGDTCLFDLGGRAREGRVDLGWDDQDLLIPPRTTSKNRPCRSGLRRTSPDMFPAGITSSL